MESPQTDRLSQLPDEILISILSKMPHREAAATAVLAKRWRYLFSSLPSLYLTGYSLLTAEDHEESPDRRWFDTVIAILAARRRPFINVHIAFDIVDEYADKLSRILRSLCDFGVEELFIAYSMKAFYELPSDVFSRGTVKNLSLDHCRVTIPCASPILSQCLTSLTLLDVFITDEDFRGLVSCLRALEDLKVVHCCKVSNLVISAPALKKLSIITIKPLNIVLANVPCLASVTVKFGYLIHHGCWRNDDEDGYSRDSWYPDEEEQTEVSRLVRFLTQMGHIESLKLRFQLSYNQWLHRENASLPKSLPSGHFLMNLKKLVVSMHFDDKYSLSILTCLLNSSPNVQEFILEEDMLKGPATIAEEDYWNKEMPPECVRNQLTTATLSTYYEDSNSWVGFAWFLLMNSQVLKRLVISYREKSDEQSASEKRKKELLLLQSAFPAVAIEYNTPNPGYNSHVY